MTAQATDTPAILQVTREFLQETCRDRTILHNRFLRNQAKQEGQSRMKIKLHEDPSNVEVGEFCGDYFATPRCRRVFGISDFHENREHGTESRSRIPMVETSGINCTKRWLPTHLLYRQNGFFNFAVFAIQCMSSQDKFRYCSLFEFRIPNLTQLQLILKIQLN